MGRKSSASGSAYPRVSVVFSPRVTIPAHGSRISSPNEASGSAKTVRSGGSVRAFVLVPAFETGSCRERISSSSASSSSASSSASSYVASVASRSSSRSLARFPRRFRLKRASFANPDANLGGAFAIPRSISCATTSSRGLWWNFTAIAGSPGNEHGLLRWRLPNPCVLRRVGYVFTANRALGASRRRAERHLGVLPAVRLGRAWRGTSTRNDEPRPRLAGADAPS